MFNSNMESLLIVFDLLEYFFDFLLCSTKVLHFRWVFKDSGGCCIWMSPKITSTQIKVQLKLNQLWY